MRIRSMTAILSLAILAGSTFVANAQVGAAANGGHNRGGNETSINDRGAGDAESVNLRRHNCGPVGAAAVDCPPKKKTTLKLAPKEDDCQCKPIAMTVGGQTRIVLDCYQTKLYNNIKRTYVCTRP